MAVLMESGNSFGSAVAIVFLLHFDKFYVEDQRSIGRNRLACSLLAVAEVVGDEETVLGTFLHQLQTLGPALDHLIEAKVAVSPRR